MGWLVSALGVALALAGAASIMAGLPYMRLEFGWTEVIAGSTALSAGIVTLALGAVLFALQGIRRNLVSSTTVAGPGLPTQTVPPFPEMEAGTPVVAPSDSAIEALPDPASPTPSPPPRMARFKAKLSTMGLPKENHPPGAEFRSVDPLVAVPASRSESGTLGVASRDEEVDTFAGGRPSIDPSHSRHADRFGVDSHDRDSDGVLDRGSIVVAPVDAEHSYIATSPDAPTVVGRYESGGSSYVLFSDGTIEVETETGTHRFGSMQELKDHIDRQDPA